MTQVRFAPRAVAFLDILGFKELVREAHASPSGAKRLSNLLDKINSNVPLNRSVKEGVPNHLRPLSIEISDSIILSTPLLDPGRPYYWGLSILVMRCAQIAAILLDEGYLLNGAINIGDVQHTRRNIVGAAYQETYAIQSTVSSPAIVLCPDAAAAWQASNYQIGRSPMCIARPVAFKGKDAGGREILEVKDAIVVNVFEPEYMNSTRGIERKGPPPPVDDAWLLERIGAIEATLAQNQARFALGAPRHHAATLAKWQWVDELFHTHGRASIESALSMHPTLVSST